MPLHPIQELTKAQIKGIKYSVKRALLSKALRDHPGSSPRDWLFRETVFGGTTTTDFYDVKWKTEALAGACNYVIDAGDLTADQLSQITAAGFEVPDDTYIGFYGIWDISSQGGELTGSAGIPPPVGSLIGVEFMKGGNTIDVWRCGKLYSHDTVMGLSDRPVIYDRKAKLRINVLFTEATLDKPVGFRAYTLEKNEEHYKLSKDYLLEDRHSHLFGGIEPLPELTVGDIETIKQRTIRELYRAAVKHGTYHTISEVKRKMYLRELWVGDSSAVDNIDFNTDTGTAQSANQENWAQDSTIWATAHDLLSAFFASNTEVPDSKYVGIYGFFDMGAVPILVALAFNDGAGRKDYWHVEHCYAYRDAPPAGLAERPIIFPQNTVIDPKGAVSEASLDTFIGFRGFMLEKYGQWR